jgi:phosphate/sulfate permease
MSTSLQVGKAAGVALAIGFVVAVLVAVFADASGADGVQWFWVTFLCGSAVLLPVAIVARRSTPGPGG